MAPPESSGFPRDIWNIPHNTFQPAPNVPFRPNYPNTLALWHNPHQIPPSETKDLLAQQRTPQRHEQRRHKRTKSGCFTCRARRVKCDETRPICERCSKGNRDCSYPAPTIPRKASRSNMKLSDKHPSIRESELEETGMSGECHNEVQNANRRDLHPRQTNDGSSRRGSVTGKQRSQPVGRRQTLQTLDKRKSQREMTRVSPSSDVTGPSTESSSPGTSTDTEILVPLSPALSEFPDLPPEVSFFIAYRKHNINYHHYMLKSHAVTFLNDDMMRHAMHYEPLLYAIVNFAAYHYSIGHPNGKIYTFLQYYNKSVSLLLKSLQDGDPHNDAMLLTILQLTVFEEFVGDWVNLIDHHQAAHDMLLELYTPETINVDSFRRHMLSWYSRYDVMAGVMSGNSLVLSREWYLSDENYSMLEVFEDPSDLDRKVMAWGASCRRSAMEMASMFAKMTQGLITHEQFLEEKAGIDETMRKHRKFLDSMRDENYLVHSYPNQRSLAPGEPFDPYVPGAIYNDDLWEVNYCAMEYVTGLLLFKYQVSMLLQKADPEVPRLALQQAQLVETLCRWPGHPKEEHIQFMSPLGMIVLLIPHDEKYTMWCQEKLARNEQLGYIYPPTLRVKLANLWKKPELLDWWLPDDESYPAIVQEIREWTKERVTDPRDTFRESVRDMKAVFGELSLDDSSEVGSSPSALSSANTETSPEASRGSMPF